MNDRLVRTKYTLPPLRSALIARPRLWEKLDRARERPITIVTAAAGFGKTTLVREWCARQSAPCAWLALDADDNDPARFLAYLLAAFRTALPVLGKNRDAQFQGAPVSPQTVLTDLINELSAAEHEIFLVLDDYHWIENTALHEALEFWIEHLPGNAHVLVTSRVDPPWALARWRARNQLIQVRVSDLRWTAAEATQFLNQGMSLALTDAQVETLHLRTEGWIAGLQLAGLALTERADAAEFIESFSGSQRYIISYLAEEVLERQPAARETFLVQTSILERFNADLCRVLTGMDDAAAQLRTLYIGNLFLISLDEQGEWFRYHYLFAQVLHARLKQTYGAEKIRQLHRTASEWFETHHRTDEAMQHALTAQDWDRAARLIQTHAQDYWRRGEMATLERWLNVFPASIVAHDARLLLVQAMTLTLTAPYQFARITELVAQAQALQGTDEANTRDLTGQLLAVASANASNQADTARTIDLAKRALRELAPGDLFWRVLTQVNLGIAYSAQGELLDASDALQTGLELAQRADVPYLGLFGRMHLGNVRMGQGQLRAARKIFSDALADAAAQHLDRSPVAGYLYSLTGKLFYEWNDLASSRVMLERALEHIDARARAWVLVGIQVDLACVALAQGDARESDALMAYAAELLQDARLEPMRRLFRAWRARLALRRGETARARDWSQTAGTGLPDESVFAGEFEAFTRARVLIALEKTNEAAALLKQLQVPAAANGRIAAVIECELLNALASARGRRSPHAQAALTRALRLAQPENFVRLFVDEGEPARQLLQSFVLALESIPQTAELNLREYAGTLLAAFGEINTTAPGKPNEKWQKTTVLSEPLSEREIEVLGLIGAGASNQDIADKLVIALPTVKRHISNIYAKLGVTSRTQALVRAQELKLL